MTTQNKQARWQTLDAQAELASLRAEHERESAELIAGYRVECELRVKAEADLQRMTEERDKYLHLFEEMEREADEWEGRYFKERSAAEAAETSLRDLQAQMTALVDWVRRERALRDAKTKGGQHTGYQPSISPSVLKQLEALIPIALLPSHTSEKK